MHCVVRLFAFTLALASGGAAWFVLAHAGAAPPQDTHADAVRVGNINGNVGSVWNVNSDGDVRVAPPGASGEGDQSAQAGDAAAWETRGEKAAGPASLRWSPLKRLYGFGNAGSVVVRSGPGANSPVLATINLSDYEQAEILEATRDSLRVRFEANGTADERRDGRDHEGWIEWGAVVPHMTALVIDAETGEAVARVPLSEDISAVTYSPDGKRVLFHGASWARAGIAYEADAEEYKLSRVLEAGESQSLGAPFYGASDGMLYAPVWSGDNNRFDILGIGGDDDEGVPTKLLGVEASNFIISPDGLTGFVMSPSSASPGQISVLDLRTFETRANLRLEGMDAEAWPTDMSVSRDGGEMYFRSSQGAAGVRVLNSRGGALLREIPLRVPENHWASFPQENLVGGSVLVKIWEPGPEEDTAKSRAVWLTEKGETPAEPGVDYAVEAGGRRYAVNERGTRLFQLDDDGRIQTRRKIARPELKHRPTLAGELTVYGLHASPDGKHLILFVGTFHGC